MKYQEILSVKLGMVEKPIKVPTTVDITHFTLMSTYCYMYIMLFICYFFRWKSNTILFHALPF